MELANLPRIGSTSREVASSIAAWNTTTGHLELWHCHNIARLEITETYLRKCNEH